MAQSNLSLSKKRRAKQIANLAKKQKGPKATKITYTKAGAALKADLSAPYRRMGTAGKYKK